MDPPPPLPANYPPYQGNIARNSFYDSNAPPAPPPKPNSQEASRRGTPAGGTPFPPSGPPGADNYNTERTGTQDFSNVQRANTPAAPQREVIQDPGENWLPEALKDVSFVVFPFWI